MSERIYDIKQAAERLGYTDQYVRKLIQDGRLFTERIPISLGALVTKHVMTETTIIEFETTVVSRSHRRDNRNKWLVYASFSEMETAITLLEENGLTEVAAMMKKVEAWEMAFKVGELEVYENPRLIESDP